MASAANSCKFNVFSDFSDRDESIDDLDDLELNLTDPQNAPVAPDSDAESDSFDPEEMGDNDYYFDGPDDRDNDSDGEGGRSMNMWDNPYNSD